ncbi:uncharacterized ferritin-like protein (DUF455 family) [Natronocella acetinitrilica]|uniref:Uncharacterized ferritin-like protein (DUF455 family) n=1 Tax=Natronocella acetinitrilica TaxID=414046 RepID=A0AAE3G0V5_9GAMM|nr:ferritin-like domain-containing protein [Natronocella acetinitrilica]MCP1673705.1 uncharacterized ferritin-like protein (DUF455 family) [Natronocella acetinitrilica]
MTEASTDSADSCLYAAAARALAVRDPQAKGVLVDDLRNDWSAGRLRRRGSEPPWPVDAPGRPARPGLVPPRDLVHRRLSTEAGRAALIHAIAHIEFNAINLALDAVQRFRDMPDTYYSDWLGVAQDEARHFFMLRRRLQSLGHDYGDFPAHDGLWAACCDTAHDVMVRMALVPRVLEARGLDVTPGMIRRLQAAKDTETVDCLRIILDEEQDHVRIGSTWFAYCCRQRGLDAERIFRDLLSRYMHGRIRGPFNESARLDAGFSREDMRLLKELSTANAGGD